MVFVYLVKRFKFVQLEINFSLNGKQSEKQFNDAFYRFELTLIYSSSMKCSVPVPMPMRSDNEKTERNNVDGSYSLCHLVKVMIKKQKWPMISIVLLVGFFPESAFIKSVLTICTDKN